MAYRFREWAGVAWAATAGVAVAAAMTVTAVAVHGYTWWERRFGRGARR